jgi:hypothetical protein
VYVHLSVGPSCLPFLPQSVPIFLHIIRVEPELRGFVFQQLVKLVSFVKSHMTEFLPAVFEAARTYWDQSCLTEIINLIEEIATTLRLEFKVRVEKHFSQES